MPPLTPELLVTDLAASLRFYVGALGFTVEFQRPEDRFAAISLQGAWLMLEQAAALGPADEAAFGTGRQWRTAALEPPFGRGVNLQVCIAGLGPVWEQVQAGGWCIRVPIEERWYRIGDHLAGVRQFLVQDPDGYLIRMQEDIGRRPDPGR